MTVQRPRIVIAPDKFKGSLTGAQVATILGDAIRRELPDGEIIEMPIADGGEGTVDAVVMAGFDRVSAVVTGPLGESTHADYAIRDGVAVIEMAAAAGLGLVPGAPDPHAAGAASTRGVGELITDAMDRGAHRIVLGLGGSATTDGGAGMISALGAVVGDGTTGTTSGGLSLTAAHHVDLSGLDPRISSTEIVVATDVDNPLVGPHGASVVYAPQKGADNAIVAALEIAMEHWADLVADATGTDMRTTPGTGAAGGTAFAAVSVLGATMRRGFDVVAGLTGLDTSLAGASVVVIGEGSLDEQSLRGKGPVGLATRAAGQGASVIAVVGRNSLDKDQTGSAGIDHVHALTDIEPRSEVCVRDAFRLMSQLATPVVETIRAVLRDRLAAGAASHARITPLSAEAYREALLSTVVVQSTPRA